MQISYLSMYLLLAGLFIQCKNKNKDELSQSEINRIIQNPITARTDAEHFFTTISGGPFEYNAGEVFEGAVIRHTFTYKNSGKVNLEINDVRSDCGCTAAAISRNKIPSGSMDSLSVSFDTKGFKGPQEKKITIFSNTRPRATSFIIRATVIATADN